MTAEQQNFDMTAGDTKVLRPTDNADGGVRDVDNGGTKDLTGATVEWVLADRPGGPAVVEKDNAGTGGVQITDAAGGVFDVSLDPADTDDLSGEYYHEAEVTDGSGDTETVWTGWIDIQQDTT